jgi:hypothetical protein
VRIYACPDVATIPEVLYSTVRKSLKTSGDGYASELRCKDREHERGKALLSARMDPLCAAGAIDSDLSHEGEEITR